VASQSHAVGLAQLYPSPTAVDLALRDLAPLGLVLKCLGGVILTQGLRSIASCNLDPARLQSLGTSRFNSIVRSPFSRLAPVTFTWSARLKVCLKERVAMPRCRT
jgi:hypothetical protein